MSWIKRPFCWLLTLYSTVGHWITDPECFPYPTYGHKFSEKDYYLCKSGHEHFLLECDTCGIEFEAQNDV